jgi:hypothetical protein
LAGSLNNILTETKKKSSKDELQVILFSDLEGTVWQISPRYDIVNLQKMLGKEPNTS